MYLMNFMSIMPVSKRLPFQMSANALVQFMQCLRQNIKPSGKVYLRFCAIWIQRALQTKAFPRMNFAIGLQICIEPKGILKALMQGKFSACKLKRLVF